MGYLPCLGSIDGAYIRACAAIDTFIRINFILGVAFGDCLHGTFWRARAAADAIVVDMICHTVTSNVVL
jgi:hypothetical protein